MLGILRILPYSILALRNDIEIIMGFTEPDAHDYPKDLHDLGSESNRVWQEVLHSVQFLRHNKRGRSPENH